MNPIAEEILMHYGMPRRSGQVTVAAIPYQESENPAGGTTVTIG